MKLTPAVFSVSLSRTARTLETVVQFARPLTCMFRCLRPCMGVSLVNAKAFSVPDSPAAWRFALLSVKQRQVGAERIDECVAGRVDPAGHGGVQGETWTTPQESCDSPAKGFVARFVSHDVMQAAMSVSA
jgi:hypothetical protein